MTDIVERFVADVRRRVREPLDVEVARQAGGPGTADVWLETPDGERQVCVMLSEAWPEVRILGDGFVFEPVRLDHAPQVVAAMLDGTAEVGTTGGKVDLRVVADDLTYTGLGEAGKLK